MLRRRKKWWCASGTLSRSVFRSYFKTQHAEITASVLPDLDDSVAKACTLDRFMLAAATVRARLLPPFTSEEPCLASGTELVCLLYLCCSLPFSLLNFWSGHRQTVSHASFVWTEWHVHTYGFRTLRNISPYRAHRRGCERAPRRLLFKLHRASGTLATGHFEPYCNLQYVPFNACVFLLQDDGDGARQSARGHSGPPRSSVSCAPVTRDRSLETQSIDKLRRAI
jgi:hypothetical protein